MATLQFSDDEEADWDEVEVKTKDDSVRNTVRSNSGILWDEIGQPIEAEAECEDTEIEGRVVMMNVSDTSLSLGLF